MSNRVKWKLSERYNFFTTDESRKKTRFSFLSEGAGKILDILSEAFLRENLYLKLCHQYPVFRFKVRLAFSVKVEMSVTKTWLNIRIIKNLFRQILTETRDHKYLAPWEKA